MTFLLNQLVVFGAMAVVVGAYLLIHFLKNKLKHVTYDEYFKNKK